MVKGVWLYFGKQFESIVLPLFALFYFNILNRSVNIVLKNNCNNKSIDLSVTYSDDYVIT